MLLSISKQAYIFIYSILCGVLIGFIYDVFRIKRKTIRTGAIITYIEDILYWIIVAILVFALIFYSNDGELRGYIFIGAIIGVILYMVTLSNIIIKTTTAILDFITKIIKLILFIIAYPFRIILKILYMPIKLLSKPVKKLFKWTKAHSKIRATKISMLKKAFKNKIKKI